ncbi:MAG: DUF502 domain-containing protein [Candidatus Dependentiae bacterium]|nr:DUF502 domain-containing protein [Candidatus Dependentiae bacterium]
MAKHKRTGIQVVLYTIWSLFLNGLFAILPLTLTVALFKFSLGLLKKWLDPINSAIEQTCLGHIPHSEILLVIFFIFLVGAILKIFILRRVVHGFEELIFRIPLIRPVYSGIKQLVSAFNLQEDKAAFKQVVLIEFPRKGLYSIGFLTGELPAELAPAPGRYFNIFVPTTPNPTTGYYIIIPEEQIMQIDLTRHEAMALVISGGIILPDQFKKEEKIQ